MADTASPIMDYTGHVRLIQTELTPTMLKGATIYGADDHKVGKIDHVHGTGSVIIDVGGFLGMGAKPVSSRWATSRSCAMKKGRYMP